MSEPYLIANALAAACSSSDQAVRGSLFQKGSKALNMLNSVVPVSMRSGTAL